MSGVLDGVPALGTRPATPGPAWAVRADDAEPRPRRPSSAPGGRPRPPRRR